MLCNYCQALFPQEAVERPKIKLPNIYIEEVWTFDRLSHHGGCFLCHQLWQAFIWTRKPTPKSLTIKRGIYWTSRPALVSIAGGEWDQRIDSESQGTEIIACTFRAREIDELEGLEMPEDSASGQLMGSEVSVRASSPQAKEDTTKSEAVLNLGLQWLHTCLRDHPLCSDSSHNAKLPTQLLEISGAESQHVRLIRTSELDFTPPYATLSHCWGNAILLKLTADTFEELSLGIFTADLPQTFQDACLVTRWIQCQYLWIDSMCIFQDSKEDWALESLTMSDVYRGSKCTIAASASYDSHGGLFRTRHPALKRRCIAKVNYTDASQETFSIDERSFSPGFHEGNQPLLKRGWVLQERFLSPRVIHFGSDYVYWECNTIDASEKYPAGISPHIRQIINDAGPFTHIKRFKDVHYNLHELWRRLVTEYSSCNLTGQVSCNLWNR